MSDRAIERLEGLAQTNPSVARLVRMQAEAVRASTDPSWGSGIPELDAARLPQGTPLLHDLPLEVEEAVLRDLLARLFAVLAEDTEPGRFPDARAFAAEVDPVAAAAASIEQDAGRLANLADAAGLESGLFAVVAQCAALPLLLAAGHEAAPLLADDVWRVGICPVCAAWPVLAELRGLERNRWLRCGRCGAGWQFGIQDCPFCANDDHRSLSYLAPEKERESRRAATCDRCRGYLKTFTTLGALAPAEVLARDATSLELDLAAMERGYARPEVRGFELRVQLERRPAQAAAG